MNSKYQKLAFVLFVFLSWLFGISLFWHRYGNFLSKQTFKNPYSQVKTEKPQPRVTPTPLEKDARFRWVYDNSGHANYNGIFVEDKFIYDQPDSSSIRKRNIDNLEEIAVYKTDIGSEILAIDNGVLFYTKYKFGESESAPVESARVVAYDTNLSKVLWESEELKNATVCNFHGSHIIHFAHDNDGLYVSNLHGIYKLDRKTGGLQWGHLSSQLALCEGRATFPMGIIPDEQDIFWGFTDEHNSRLYSFNKNTGKVNWEKNVDVLYGYGSRIYLANGIIVLGPYPNGSAGNKVLGINKHNGVDLFEVETSITNIKVTENGFLVAAPDYIKRIDSTGNLFWRYNFADNSKSRWIWQTESKVILQKNDEIHILDKKTGTLLREESLGLLPARVHWVGEDGMILEFERTRQIGFLNLTP